LADLLLLLLLLKICVIRKLGIMLEVIRKIKRHVQCVAHILLFS